MAEKNRNLFSTVAIYGDIDMPKGLTEADFRLLFQAFLEKNDFLFDGTTRLKN